MKTFVGFIILLMSIASSIFTVVGTVDIITNWWGFVTHWAWIFLFMPVFFLSMGVICVFASAFDEEYSKLNTK